MKALLLSSESESDLSLLLALAEKLGIRTRTLSTTEVEDMGLAFAMQNGRTGEIVPTDEVLKELRK